MKYQLLLDPSTLQGIATIIVALGTFLGAVTSGVISLMKAWADIRMRQLPGTQVIQNQEKISSKMDAHDEDERHIWGTINEIHEQTNGRLSDLMKSLDDALARIKVLEGRLSGMKP